MLVTITAQKGGVGKTTTAVHVAAALQRHAPTLLIDEENAGAMAWAEADQLPFRTVTKQEAARVHTRYAHTVVDMGGRPRAADVAELTQHSDFLLIPTTPDALALRALQELLPAVRGSRYAVLLTITPPHPSTAATEAREALEALGVNLLSVDVPRAVALQKAALAGVTVDQVRDSRAAAVWSVYAQVGREVLEHVGEK